jgi:hypothetical protein
MKKTFWAVTLLALFVFGSRDLLAQEYYYDPYGYVQYQQDVQYWQQYDPYYTLHVMHYQLYLPQYQSYQLYQPCCYAGVVAIPAWPAPIRSQPRAAIIPRSQMVVGPLPRATGPLPRATSVLPPAIGRR